MLPVLPPGDGNTGDEWEKGMLMGVGLAGGMARLEFEMRRNSSGGLNGWKLKDGSGQNLPMMPRPLKILSTGRQGWRREDSHPGLGPNQVSLSPQVAHLTQ